MSEQRDILITIGADASNFNRTLRNVAERLLLHGVQYERLGEVRRELDNLHDRLRELAIDHHDPERAANLAYVAKSADRASDALWDFLTDAHAFLAIERAGNAAQAESDPTFADEDLEGLGVVRGRTSSHAVLWAPEWARPAAPFPPMRKQPRPHGDPLIAALKALV